MTAWLAQRFLGIVLLLAGAWGLIAPQAGLGLPALRWMTRYAFPGEALVGMLLVALAYSLLDFKLESKLGSGRNQ